MKLLFDENLSPRLVKLLKEEFPESKHVRDVDLRGAFDSRIWEYCRENNFVIVSKDSDFREMSYLEGAPPKIIWVDVGNSGTIVIGKLLNEKKAEIDRFLQNKEESLLILSSH